MVMLNANYIDEIKPEDCEYEVVEHLNRSTSLQGYTDPVNYSDLKTLFIGQTIFRYWLTTLCESPD